MRQQWMPPEIFGRPGNDDLGLVIPLRLGI
jgi:hypothetical protein